MSSIVSLPVAVQLEFDTEPDYAAFHELYECRTCNDCVNDCKIYTISEDAEVFCIRYKKEK